MLEITFRSYEIVSRYPFIYRSRLVWDTPKFLFTFPPHLLCFAASIYLRTFWWCSGYLRQSRSLESPLSGCGIRIHSCPFLQTHTLGFAIPWPCTFFNSLGSWMNSIPYSDIGKNLCPGFCVHIFLPPASSLFPPGWSFFVNIHKHYFTRGPICDGSDHMYHVPWVLPTVC